MSWWRRLLGGRSDRALRSQRLDYLNEALALERTGDFDAALTSYRLALRNKPDDVGILENMAIAYSKLGRADEAARCYRRALEVKPDLPGAHYGLGFILLRRDERSEAEEHLEAFLRTAGSSSEMEGWIDRARAALERLRGPQVPDDAGPSFAPPPPGKSSEPPVVET